MYNNQGAPRGPYAPPGGYNNYQAPAPGMGAPGMGPPPGVGGAPGMNQPSPAAYSNGFQAPPNVNFNAPVVRLGFDSAPQGQNGDQYSRGAPGGRDRQGGGDRRGQGVGFSDRPGGFQSYSRETINPPSREEMMRTIFVGNIPEGVQGDEGMHRILSCAGDLTKWTRARDASDKPCTFGFAEFGDHDTLDVAMEIFQDVRVPKLVPKLEDVAKVEKEEKKGDVVKEETAKVEKNGDQTMTEDGDETTKENGEDEDANVKEEDEEEKQQQPAFVVDDKGQEMVKLLFVFDENSKKYAEEWREKGSLKDPAARDFRLDNARDELNGVLASFLRYPDHRNGMNGMDTNGDTMMHNGDGTFNPAASDVFGGLEATGVLDDELGEIPAEAREAVLKEIAAFRDRSIRRDLKRLQQEEQQERDRVMAPQASAGANNIPVGPRAGIANAPLGPRGYNGAQLPNDYRNGVAFVGLNTEDDDDSASDSELERRRTEKKKAQNERSYADRERLWLNRERTRTAALEREERREKEEDEKAARLKEKVAERLKTWDDDEEAREKREEYYADRTLWLRSREKFRIQEEDADNEDRYLEDREKREAEDRRNKELGVADQFLGQMGEELAQKRGAEPVRATFKMSLGAAAAQRQKKEAETNGKKGGRSAMEVEGLLEDEEETGTTTRRTLIPIAKEDLPPMNMSEEERKKATRQLAAEIPTDTEALFQWPVAWKYIDDTTIEESIRPFLERKIMEYVGVVEELLVKEVEEGLRKHLKPMQLVEEMEAALDRDDAMALIKKVWRMVIYFAEAERRGLN